VRALSTGWLTSLWKTTASGESSIHGLANFTVKDFCFRWELYPRAGQHHCERLLLQMRALSTGWPTSPDKITASGESSVHALANFTWEDHCFRWEHCPRAGQLHLRRPMLQVRALSTRWPTLPDQTTASGGSSIQALANFTWPDHCFRWELYPSAGQLYLTRPLLLVRAFPIFRVLFNLIYFKEILPKWQIKSPTSWIYINMIADTACTIMHCVGIYALQTKGAQSSRPCIIFYVHAGGYRPYVIF
jgi:hypothetical protein